MNHQRIQTHSNGGAVGTSPELPKKSSYATNWVKSNEGKNKSFYNISVIKGMIGSKSAGDGCISSKDRTCVVEDPQKSFKPFQFKGSVAKESSSSDMVNVVIKRDTASNHSIIVRSALPEGVKSNTGRSIVLAGVGGSELAPVCRLHKKGFSYSISGFRYKI